MNTEQPQVPDDFQQAWQAQSSKTRLTIDADLLIREFLRNQSGFQNTIFWRDFREVAIALIMIPVWIYLGIANALPWTWYLTIPVLIWIAGFMIVYRMRYMQKPSEIDEPLIKCVQRSLIEQENQIWLLRNLVWWYLLPPTLSIMAFFAQVIFTPDIPLVDAGGWSDFLARLIVFLSMSLLVIVIYYFVYLINQQAVKTQLEPRRLELLELLKSLEDESNGGINGEYPLLTGPNSFTVSPRRSFASYLLAAIITLLGMSGILYVAYHLDDMILHEINEEYPKLSPFAAVRWEEDQPEVKVDKEWYRLISINDIPSEEIVTYSQETFGDLWQKRFEEDLVELLTRMGHEPGNNVTLVVESPRTSEKQVLKDVLMTRENRRAIRNTAQAQEQKLP
ncbi:hypothetical protein [Rubinisphaera italica]|uniref:MraY-like glycosyltransferase n=1 Tax=Rubinisphaera italica TaxID=2527969 RepID=A0A5C5XKQ2_9PLAN|nr:hypothetical protein [Rubinisphaera italica]TWT63011.1 hypothetical protein Pan54_37620 [Rubinisphaera italica]